MLFLLRELQTRILKRQRRPVAYFRRILIDECNDKNRIGVGSVTGYIGEAMDEPPFSLAYVMVKESFAVPAVLF